MKLINREPTEEMVKAAGLHYESEKYTGCTSTFKVMYDAAPEIKINMEPDSYEQVATLQAEIERLSNGWHDANAETLKLTEERDSLKAENKRLWNEVAELKQDAKSCTSCSHVQVEKITAERNELLHFIKYAQVSSGVCCCGDTIESHNRFSDHMPVDVWDNAVAGFVAKYEGEKHD